MIESDADRLALLRALGESVTTPRGTLLCLFDSPPATDQFSGENVGVNSPRIIVRTSDLLVHLLARGVRVIYGTEYYKVRRTVDDGDGWTTVFLEL